MINEHTDARNELHEEKRHAIRKEQESEMICALSQMMTLDDVSYGDCGTTSVQRKTVHTHSPFAIHSGA